MNRVEKEMLKKRIAERKGLTEEECRRLDQLDELTRELHSELFPEETDFMMDSSSEAKERRRGKNPMNPDYTEMVNARRQSLGVPPLGPNGLPTENSSWLVARKEAERRLGKKPHTQGKGTQFVLADKPWPSG